jgi:hypothetical protein
MTRAATRAVADSLCGLVSAFSPGGPVVIAAHSP